MKKEWVTSDILYRMADLKFTSEQLRFVVDLVESVLADEPQSRPKIPEEVRVQILERDGYCCKYCGTDAERLVLDHVIPFSRGGATSPENLVAACARCNGSKKAKTPEEWRA